MKNLITILISGALIIPAFVNASEKGHREFKITREKSLSIQAEITFGNVMIRKGDSEKSVSLDFNDRIDDKKNIAISYETEGDTGILRIKMKKHENFWRDDEDRGDDHRYLTVGIPGDIPVALDIELGAGKGDLDLTGLRVREFKISSGASNVNIRCDKPNKIIADNVVIESGVSRVTASELSNLNFRNLQFCGGVGAYKLDFSGSLREDADVKVEVGLGSISISIPKSFPAKVIYDDNWFSSFEIDDGFIEKEDGVFETEETGDIMKSLTIRLDSGLGSVRIKRK
jgi:hypothetical protein